MRTRSAIRVAALSLIIGVGSSSVAAAQPGSNILLPGTISLTSFSPDSFFLNSFTFPVNLRHTVAGLTPTHYRYSRFSDFRDAQWIAYQPTPVVTIPQSWYTPIAGSSNTQFSTTLYFQLRARNPKAGQPVSIAGGTTTLQPDFVNSNSRNKILRVTFAG